MKNSLTYLLASFLVAARLCGQAPVRQPKILGIAHVAYYVSNLPGTLTYYKDFLGFAEPYDLMNADGSVHVAFIKIDDHQHLELFAEPAQGDGMLAHIAFYTNNAEQMRRYLISRGIKAPNKVGKGKTGDKNFMVKDPDGHMVEIVEYQRDGWAMKGRGKDMPATRVSYHILHTGFTVLSLEKSKEFYSGILGFKEFWRGSSDDITLSWVNLQVPDGKDYVELMLYKDLPGQDKRGGANHISLMAPDVTKAVATLQTRATAADYTRKIEIHVGHNRRRQANFFDPDGTRSELMEPVTIDGKPATPSPAPPPRE
jgi:lactoylglutathione lyase